jgi:hypothetical protein
MIRKITWPKIVDILHTAKNEVYLIMPSIHEEWIDILKSNPNISNLQIFACIDNSETVIRNGYGSISSIDSLNALNAVVTECPGIRICFISADDDSFFLFLESRIIAGDPDGFNAVEVNPQDAAVFVKKFFNTPDANKEEIISQPLQEETLSEVKEAIKINPPDAPDLKRKIGTYNTLFQYAELHLEGGNLSSKTISIPSDALPFKDVELKNRIKTRINLFTKEITDKWTELSELKTKVDEVRKNYLVTCSIRKEKSILKKENKLAFKNAIIELESLASDLTNKLQNKVQTAINNSEDTLRNELIAFFAINPPKGIENLDYKNAKIHVDKVINTILSKIKLPEASTLISKIKINQMYYELTWEDLNDKEFKKWFIDKGLISKEDDSKIANFSNAFKVRK